VDTLIIYIFYVKGDRRSYAVANSVSAQLYENLGVEAQTLVLDTKKVDSIAQHVAEMVRDMNVIGVALVIGPSSVSDYEDRRLRDAVERAFRFRGLFCWYISISSRGRKGGSGKEQDISRIILHKLSVIMKELAIRLSLFPHKLQPLELVVGSGKEVVNVVGAADATVVGLERGQLRVGEALLVMNIAEDRPILETDAETSMQGEDAVLAKLVRKALSYANGSRIVMYVNRARPEALLNYMDEAEAREVLNKVIIVGATKTHTYPRILKAVGNHFANPEITAYYHLNTKELSNMNAVTSRYLAVTTSAWRESFEGGLTVKPTLLTIVASKEIANQQNIENILRYTITLCILNNTSTWIHSLPWSLHRVDKILKTAHRLAQTQDEIVATLKNKEIAKIL
jgi:glutaredoxin 2